MMLFYYLHMRPEEDKESFCHNNQSVGRKPNSGPVVRKVMPRVGCDVLWIWRYEIYLLQNRFLNTI
jgi:hypothetical protein